MIACMYRLVGYVGAGWEMDGWMDVCVCVHVNM